MGTTVAHCQATSMNSTKLFRALALLLATSAATGAVGCASDSGEGDDEDLTSQSALSRSLKFQGKVYVRKDATDSEIQSAVLTQTQSAFGPLRTSDIAVNNRELKPLGAALESFKATFQKRVVKVIDTALPADPGTEMTEVIYTYTDNAVVAKSYARKSKVALAVLNPSYRSQLQRILKECTTNDEEAREFLSSAWYIFQPNLSTCKTAMATETKAIAADRLKLTDTQTQVTKSDVNRLYVPITAALGPDKTNKGNSYPDYHRLYAGGVEPGKLVISLVYGMIDHSHTGGPEDDYAYSQYMQNLSEILKENPNFKLTGASPATDVTKITLASGRSIPITMKDLVASGNGIMPGGVSGADAAEAKKLLGQLVYKRFLTYEMPVKVRIGNDSEKAVTIKILGYYGAESDSAPHKTAIKNSDVFVYNGHSSIGYGPLDPSRFSASDFPKTYQIMFVDSCVSYNYYEKDYVPLKEGGTLNLDLITNGIEAPAYRSGEALGKFVAKLINGKQASYLELLGAASATDSLRVVDGELDNKYTPTAYPITVRK
ncbi:MAG: hypothetical protein U0174_17795 [Polyangiaceae bacterium]